MTTATVNLDRVGQLIRRYGLVNALTRDQALEVVSLARDYYAAEIFATHDPDVDWPSRNHSSAIDAIMAAIDRLREPEGGTR